MDIVKPAVFFMAFSTLLLEILLIRVFDVIIYSNISYMVISCALFSFGLAGVYATLKPFKKETKINLILATLAFLFGIFAIILLPILNLLPFDFDKFGQHPIIQLISFIALYIVLILPFFFSGLFFATVFSRYAEKIQSLYFWDLTGASFGCILIIPLIPVIGPGGLLLCIGALTIIASGLLSKNKKWIYFSLIAGVILILAPFLKNGYYDFKEHTNKRGVKSDKETGKIEFTFWDPVSKIDVINEGKWKHVAYDGGSQSSTIYPFDGNFSKLRSLLPDSANSNFWHRGVLASHFLKRNTDAKVLVIGSAAGQEVKAALAYEAGSIDAVEMVGTVMELGLKKYAKYNGNIFLHPNIKTYVDEGRRFLSGNNKRYDIIQIFSNHTTSSLASGSGAMEANYLHTYQAYQEYFKHLKYNAILHINHHIYPKIITTLALAWKKMGRRNFRAHVVVFEREGLMDNLPTLLVKMNPWTKNEIDSLKNFFSTKPNSRFVFNIVENPFDKQHSFLSDDFYNGNLKSDFLEKIPYRVTPLTDNKPYFDFLRKHIKRLKTDSIHYVNFSTAALLNSRLTARKSIPLDIIHIIVVGLVSIIATFLFIIIPLKFSSLGKSMKWPNKYYFLAYFSALGAGFIIIELILIQIFMLFIGTPLYTYTSVLFVLLLSAGIGSISSQKLKINPSRRWYLPFLGIFIWGIIILLIYPYIFNLFLSYGILIRILISTILIFPLGLFLGMPFPLGILLLEKQPSGAIAWAWGLNGLFTVAGGLLCVVLSVLLGFLITISVALIIYLIAFLIYSRIRKVSPVML